MTFWVHVEWSDAVMTCDRANQVETATSTNLEKIYPTSLICMQPLYKPEKTWGNHRLINANHRGNHLSIYKTTKHQQHHSNIIPPEFVHHPHLWIPGFMAVFTHLTVSARIGWPNDSRFTIPRWNPEPSDLPGIASAAGSTKKDLEAPDNKLESTCHKPGSTSILQHLFLFMGHGSSCIMMNEEFSTPGARSGSNSFV